MKRFHVHVAVRDLKQSIRFYSFLFGTAPSIEKPDYAKWMLDDPRINFAISTRAGAETGIDHLGIQAESNDELEDLSSRLAQADVATTARGVASCCYAKSDKYWVTDPQGVAWESFRTLDTIPVYGVDRKAKSDPAEAKACCG